MPQPAIRFENVRFGWPKNPDVLSVPTLDIQAGERVFLAGPSGSGKSSLLNLVSGVSVAGSGRVEVLGQDLAALSPSGRDRFRANHLGLVFQLFNLVPYLSVLENVLLPCRFSRRRRGNAAAHGGAHAEAERLLAGLGIAHLSARPATDLSVGEQQRTAVARALLGSPEILVADEPTSALDEDGKDAFLDVLLQESARTQTTVLFVSHDRTLASHFDRTLDMRDLNRRYP